MKYKETKSLKQQFLMQHVWDSFETGFAKMQIMETSVDMYVKVIDLLGASMILKINRNWDVQEVPAVRGTVIKTSEVWC